MHHSVEDVDNEGNACVCVCVCVQEMQVQSLGWEDPLEEKMAIHSSILAGKIP